MCISLTGNRNRCKTSLWGLKRRRPDMLNNLLYKHYKKVKMYYDPAIKSFFRAIPSQILEHEFFKLKHPGAIYNNMVNEFLGVSEELIKAIKCDNIEEMKHYLRLAFSSFYQFYDSCYEMMIPFCAKHVPKKSGEFWYKWLEKHGYSAGQVFHQKTYDKVKRLKDIYNELKHSSTRIEIIKFYNGRDINYGYFFNPARQIPISPVSISRQVREFQYLVYFISEELERALIHHVGTVHAYFLPYKRLKDDGVSFQNIFGTITSLSRFYLLNEVGLRDFEAKEVDNEIQFYLNVITEDLYDKYYERGINLSVIFSSDGYHNTFNIPFCGMSMAGDPMSPKLFFQKKNGEKCWIPILYKKT